MRRSKLTRLGGFGALVGGTLWPLSAGVGYVAPPGFVGVLAVATVFLVLGVAGLQRRQATRPGVLTNVSLALTLIGSVLLAYGSVGRVEVRGDVMGLAFGPLVYSGVAGGAFVFGAGVALTAISAIAADVLPRLSPIPLLVGGLGVAAAAGIALGRQIAGDVGPAALFPLDALPFVALWVVFGLGWLWLGYLLWSEGRRDPSFG
jgi:hypothetical protein